MIHDKAIRVGACNWDHPHWKGVFYPDDLPENWRLSYYANEFSAVLVSEDKWLVGETLAEEMDEWVDEVPDNFRFYFQGDSQSVWVSQIKEIMGDKFAGFVNSGIELIEYKNQTLREWKVWLENKNCEAIFLSDKDLSPAQLADFKSLLELMGK